MWYWHKFSGIVLRISSPPELTYSPSPRTRHLYLWVLSSLSGYSSIHYLIFFVSGHLITWVHIFCFLPITLHISFLDSPPFLLIDPAKDVSVTSLPPSTILAPVFISFLIFLCNHSGASDNSFGSPYHPPSYISFHHLT